MSSDWLILNEMYELPSWEIQADWIPDPTDDGNEGEERCLKR